MKPSGKPFFLFHFWFFHSLELLIMNALWQTDGNQIPRSNRILSLFFHKMHSKCACFCPVSCITTGVSNREFSTTGIYFKMKKKYYLLLEMEIFTKSESWLRERINCIFHGSAIPWGRDMFVKNAFFPQATSISIFQAYEQKMI